VSTSGLISGSPTQTVRLSSRSLIRACSRIKRATAPDNRGAVESARRYSRRALQRRYEPGRRKARQAHPERSAQALPARAPAVNACSTASSTRTARRGGTHLQQARCEMDELGSIHASPKRICLRRRQLPDQAGEVHPRELIVDYRLRTTPGGCYVSWTWPPRRVRLCGAIC
jgi:hypothetical protein